MIYFAQKYSKSTDIGTMPNLSLLVLQFWSVLSQLYASLLKGQTFSFIALFLLCYPISVRSVQTAFYNDKNGYAVVQFPKRSGGKHIRSSTSFKTDKNKICTVAAPDNLKPGQGKYLVKKVRKVKEYYWCQVDLGDDPPCDTEGRRLAWIRSDMVEKTDRPKSVKVQQSLIPKVESNWPKKWHLLLKKFFMPGGNLGKCESPKPSLGDQLIAIFASALDMKSPVALRPCNDNEVCGCKVASEFSLSRFHPIDLKYKSHTGIDLGLPEKTKVMAPKAGEITYFGYTGKTGYGYKTVLRHDLARTPPSYFDDKIQGDRRWMLIKKQTVCGLPMVLPVQEVTTDYSHLHKSSNKLYNNVQTQKGRFVDPVRVDAGQVIGYSGNTGHSTAAHLHMEVWLSLPEKEVLPKQLLKNCIITNKAPRTIERSRKDSVQKKMAKWKNYYCDPRLFISFPRKHIKMFCGPKK